MMNFIRIGIYFSVLTVLFSCAKKPKKIETNLTAADILGNPEYLAISYGGYREVTRDVQPTIPELKEDMKILAAMNVKILRTYNVHLAQASNLLAAISELQKEDPTFEMYVMLGAWIDCKNAWTELEPDHNLESERNAVEIKTAVELANKYPEIVKIIAVGNEAMVKWAASYYVQPSVILKWVNHLQELKKKGELPFDLWVTSSDDFASWGGGDTSYRTPDLEKLIKTVDYVSMHTYPMHNTYYNPQFWEVPDNEKGFTDLEKVDAAMLRALEFAKKQYQDVSAYVKSIDSTKTIHIGESGWTTISDGHYGKESSRAADEYKAGSYYKMMREWTNVEKISLFYFEAFDEQWKDSGNPIGSENHFGLINLKGQAKYAIWELVDAGVFEGLTRDSIVITKTYNGDKNALMQHVLVPPSASEKEEK
ncbi:Exo-beta-1,3-glucanase, GH17 family [Lutibacter flavus]|uniref:Endo-1,3-beta-glucanase btgC n=2 Tax=Lutibacter flavus TaxID=691689 RepID=A0A238YFK2_9FLAO|nr:glycosyl hydrolase family 17 [Lutibacter flavus]SNR69752.1 Exo-beta-1,3-glucanase, GH17 family [Lutibacter flavus]